ncbi:MAG: 16S rRNA (uracil(1498)-N(3))-methyltransferase [Bacteroidales bacterium]|nr:16S rRNA (uracil(1498)-N(3))-methyltransferase [Bacteroidales bacterium]
MIIRSNTPYFFCEQYFDINQFITISPEEAKHIIKSHRLTKGDEVILVNGKGLKGKAIIIDHNVKHTVLSVVEVINDTPLPYKLHIAMSILQHPERFEWFVEKATEIGISEITPIITQRTVKKNINTERLRKIAIAAIKQSRQSYLPIINNPLPFIRFLKNFTADIKAIAVCFHERVPLSSLISNNYQSYLFLIGPEGDFTDEEIKLAHENQFISILLGHNILRTETSGIYIATILKNFYSI